MAFSRKVNKNIQWVQNGYYLLNRKTRSLNVMATLTKAIIVLLYYMLFTHSLSHIIK